MGRFNHKYPGIVDTNILALRLIAFTMVSCDKPLCPPMTRQILPHHPSIALIGALDGLTVQDFWPSPFLSQPYRQFLPQLPGSLNQDEFFAAENGRVQMSVGTKDSQMQALKEMAFAIKERKECEAIGHAILKLHEPIAQFLRGVTRLKLEKAGVVFEGEEPAPEADRSPEGVSDMNTPMSPIK